MSDHRILDRLAQLGVVNCDPVVTPYLKPVWGSGKEDYELSNPLPLSEAVALYQSAPRREWREQAGKDYQWSWHLKGDGVEGSISSDGVLRFTQFPSFRNAFMWMAASSAGPYDWFDPDQLVERFKRNSGRIQVIAGVWPTEASQDEDTWYHNQWQSLLRESWAYQKESRFADGYCAMTCLFTVLTGRQYPVAFAY